MSFYESGSPSLDYRCGHCGLHVATGISWSFGSPRRAIVTVCSNGACSSPTLFFLGSEVPTQRGLGAPRVQPVIAQLPTPPIDTYADDVVPESVARRYEDTQAAVIAGLWGPALMSARATVQTMAREEDVARGTVKSEIDALVEKRGDQLAELVGKIAHRIRDVGNETLHPEPEKRATREEAEEAVLLLKALIEWLYALPKRLEAAEAAVTDEIGEDTPEAGAAGAT